MPLLSIIIPVYNRSKLLTEAIKSVRSQGFEDYELIVVDDGSADDTPAVLVRLGEGQAPGKFRVLHQSNAGQGAARNLAIAEARGEYCMFLDSDDLFFPWTLTTVADAIQNNGRPSVLLGRELCFSDDPEFATAKYQTLQTQAWPDLYTYAAQNRLGPCGILVARTELLREVGGFLTERMVGEDADLMLRLGTAPNMVKINAPSMYGYRRHTENYTLKPEAWYRGACAFIHRYRSGGFPGGPARAAEIRKRVAAAIACYSFMCLYHGSRMNFCKVYIQTVGLQLRAKQYRYVFRMPLRLALSVIGLWPRKGTATDTQLWGR